MKVIHSTGYVDLIRFLERTGGKYPFILAGSEGENAGRLLKERGLREIGLAELGDGEMEACEREYIRSIARLHHGQDPLAWWTNSLPEKKARFPLIPSFVKYLQFSASYPSNWRLF